MSSEKLVNFFLNEELYNKLKTIALRERRTVKEILNEEIQDYVKVHGEGNPNFEITQFFEPEFNICPALFRPRDAWKSYIEKRNPKELQELKNQIIMLDKELSKVI